MGIFQDVKMISKIPFIFMLLTLDLLSYEQFHTSRIS